MLYISVSLAVSRPLAKTSNPVSKYNDSVEAKIESPETTLAACSCTFSNFSTTAEEQTPHRTEASSNISLIKVRYNFDNFLPPNVNYSFFKLSSFFASDVYYIIVAHRTF